MPGSQAHGIERVFPIYSYVYCELPKFWILAISNSGTGTFRNKRAQLADVIFHFLTLSNSVEQLHLF